MAQILSGRQSGTYADNDPIPSGTSSKDVSNREDLANFISMITRDETPFMSSIGKTKATSIYHEWQTDELQAPGDSKLAEGLDFVQIPSNGVGVAASDHGKDFAYAGPNRTRLGNYCQINGKSMSISGTRRVIDQAGVADEYAYQLKKRGTELRRDVEHDLIHSYNAAAGGGTIRYMGGYQSFINDGKTVQYVGSAAAGASTGDGRNTIVATAAAGAADKAPLSLSDVDEVMQKIYEEGGKATRIMVSPKLRRDFSDLMVTDTGVRRNLDEKGKLRQSVDVYMSDFGDLMVVPNYVMGLSNTVTPSATSGRTAATNDTDVNVADYAALIYDPQWFSMATLRPLQEVDVGQKGDSTVGMMVEEFTFEVKNPIGCGAIYGLE